MAEQPNELSSESSSKPVAESPRTVGKDVRPAVRSEGWNRLKQRLRASWQPLLVWYRRAYARRPALVQQVVLASVGLAIVSLMIFAAKRFSGEPEAVAIPISAQRFPVSFATNVEDATLTINGKLFSGTILNLDPGEYIVRASKPGYQSGENRFKLASRPLTVALSLQPEPHKLRISADLPGARVFLDGSSIGTLQDGSFTFDLISEGRHKVEVMDGGNVAFSVNFEALPGEAARLTAPVSSRDLPVFVISSLGTQAFAYSSNPQVKAILKNGDAQGLSDANNVVALPASSDQVTFDDGKNPLTLMLEGGNAPVLTISASMATQGLLLVESNVDNAQVFLNGRARRSLIQRGRWALRVDPGEYRIRVAMPGYEEVPEQEVAVTTGKTSPVRFDLRPAVTSAYLRIEGGTPDAVVSLDGREVGTLDAAGSLGPLALSPDAEHTIRLQKENHEPAEVRRRANVKETILISSAQVRLKPFGTLIFDVQPANAQVTFYRQGEPPRKMTDKTVPVREGSYIVSGVADQYEPFQSQVQITAGRASTVRVALVGRVRTASPPVAAPKRVETAKDLFGAGVGWTQQNDGFWMHAGTSWFSRNRFSHTLEVLRVKKLFGREKPRWRIYTSEDEYIESELSDTSLSTRRCSASGKCQEWDKRPHGLGDKEFYPLDLTVEAERISQRVGQAAHIVTGPADGRTGFVGKVGLRLIR